MFGMDLEAAGDTALARRAGEVVSLGTILQREWFLAEQRRAVKDYFPATISDRSEQHQDAQ